MVWLFRRFVSVWRSAAASSRSRPALRFCAFASSATRSRWFDRIWHVRPTDRSRVDDAWTGRRKRAVARFGAPKTDEEHPCARRGGRVEMLLQSRAESVRRVVRSGAPVMRRYPSRYVSSFSFGPGPLSSALKTLIGINVALFFLQVFSPVVTDVLGLQPREVVRSGWAWQLVTYMFL